MGRHLIVMPNQKGTIYQYNYSHDNEGGFMLICAFEDWYSRDHIVRYNISQNDKLRIIELYGHTENSLIYNNTIYMGSGISNAQVVHIMGAGNAPTNPENTYFYNNIFYNLSSGAYYLATPNAINTVFNYNLFYGNSITDEPSDANKLTSDPKFVNPGSGGTGINTVDGYKLQWDSPCINSGMSVSSNGGKDYWGNTLYDDAPDRGAHEYVSSMEIYKEDFNDGLAQNWLGVSGTWAVESNEYSGTSGFAYSYYNGTNSTFDNFIYNVKARFVGSTQRDLNILFRYQDANNYYNLYISKYPGYEYIKLYKMVNGSYSQIGTEQAYNAPIDTDMNISIRCEENVITATVNDGSNVKTVSATDNTYTSGKIGLCSNQSHIHFDNIEVYK